MTAHRGVTVTRARLRKPAPPNVTTALRDNLADLARTTGRSAAGSADVRTTGLRGPAAFGGAETMTGQRGQAADIRDAATITEPRAQAVDIRDAVTTSGRRGQVDIRGAVTTSGRRGRAAGIRDVAMMIARRGAIHEAAAATIALPRFADRVTMTARSVRHSADSTTRLAAKSATTRASVLW